MSDIKPKYKTYFFLICENIFNLEPKSIKQRFKSKIELNYT